MSDTPQNRNGSSKDAQKRSIDWDRVTGVSAVIIGVIAILISAYTAFSTRQQTYAQVWPHVEVGATGLLPTFMRQKATIPNGGGGLFAVNNGVGPAIIRSVEVSVDGRPVPDWNHVFEAIGYTDRPPQTATSALNGRVFSPTQKIYLVATVGRKNWLHLKQKLFARVTIRTCYCSVLGDCWIHTMKPSLARDQRTRSVASCAKIPKEDKFHG